MADNAPTTFHLDVTSANGTPLRFVLTPGHAPESSPVRYYDRRYTLAPGEFGYHPVNFNEDGQGCGPSLNIDAFTEGPDRTIRGWHEIDVWDIDPRTRALVGSWISHVLNLN